MTAPNMDVMRAEFEAWHVKHFLEPVTRSPGGSDYRNETVRRRWEGWQGANEPKPEPENVGDRCYAPSCGCWDGNPECTCKRLQNSD